MFYNSILKLFLLLFVVFLWLWVSRQERRKCYANRRAAAVAPKLASSAVGPHFSAPQTYVCLLNDNLIEDLKTSLFRQHWPIGRAIFHTKNKDMVAWVNHSEHLTMRSLEKRGNVRAAVSRLQSFVSILQKQLKFSKNETLGYLTLKPQCIGICFLAAKTALQILIFFCVWSTWNSVNSKVVQGSSRACMHLHKLSCT